MPETEVTPEQLMDQTRQNFTRILTGQSEIGADDAWIQAVAVTARNNDLTAEDCWARLKLYDP